jgi:predicted DNA-binding WGR domain protein
MKWILVKESDGQRGDMGKKKVYEIVLNGSTVTVMWGKFEETHKQQTLVKEFGSAYSARQWADEQRNAKRKKGYNLLMVA